MIMESLPSRIFYAADLLLGRMGGDSCPNCGVSGKRNPIVVPRHGGISPIFECANCQIHYRPVGIKEGKLLQFYYSHLYGGVKVPNSRDREIAERGVEEKSDRSKTLAPIVESFGSRKPRICVLGCSWGYEMKPLGQLGCEVIGIELSTTHREFGQSVLKLSIFANELEVAREVGQVDILMSSHVLEHVPAATALLDRISKALTPTVQVHFTPCVEAMGKDVIVNGLVGREHPLGITRKFWQWYGKSRGLTVETSVDGAEPGVSWGETTAILRRES
jgi:hypothetical protein